jgi:nucleotide-binding universal stress UspA family protein
VNSAPVEPTREDIRSSVFDGVIAGVDGTEAGLEATRQAARLVAPDGWLELFAAVYLAEAPNGWPVSEVAEERQREADERIRQAAAIAGARAELQAVNGPPLQSFLQEIERKQATLAVVGTHGHSRLAGIMSGSVAGELLHRAPCSVLFARPPLTNALFPRAIVAGADGSPESERAVAVAQELAERFAAPLRVVTALKGKFVDLGRAERAGPVEVFNEHPVRVLVRASMDADLLVVGSRGLHGVKSLGSISERVAHQAACSVLVSRSR